MVDRARDGENFFLHPTLVAFLLSWSVGVVDTYGYEKYGIFTTNQAGNLVVLAGESWRDWERSSIAVLSLLGAVGGVVIGLALRGRFRGPLGLRVVVPIGFGAAVLVGVMVMSLLNIDRNQLAVPLMSLGITCVAVGVLETPALRGWLTASTGSLLYAIAFASKGLDAHWRDATTTVARAASILTLGFVAGAFTYGTGTLAKPHPLIFGLIPMVVTVFFAVIGTRRERRAEHTRAEP